VLLREGFRLNREMVSAKFADLRKRKSAKFADFLRKSQQQFADTKKKVSKIEFEITSTHQAMI
jgi:hypothetical protein